MFQTNMFLWCGSPFNGVPQSSGENPWRLVTMDLRNTEAMMPKKSGDVLSTCGFNRINIGAHPMPLKSKDNGYAIYNYIYIYILQISQEHGLMRVPQHGKIPNALTTAHNIGPNTYLTNPTNKYEPWQINPIHTNSCKLKHINKSSSWRKIVNFCCQTFEELSPTNNPAYNMCFMCFVGVYI